MKRITIATLCMALITAVQAQDINFGVTAGPNLSTAKMKGDGVEQPKSVVGFQIGAFAEFGLADKISLRPELKYLTLGYKFPPEEDLYGYRSKVSYITLPVLAEYAVTEKLKVGLGPYVSTKLVAKDKLIPYSGEDTEAEDEDYSFDYSDADNDEIKSLDYGISTGVSYLISPKLSANLRYSHGLSNIFKTEATDGSKAYNRIFSLGVSYTIPLNKGKK